MDGDERVSVAYLEMDHLVCPNHWIRFWGFWDRVGFRSGGESPSGPTSMGSRKL